MKKSMSERVADVYSRYFPDAFIFAIVLSLFAILGAIFFTDSSPIAVLGYWFDGFPMLFTFAFQLIITYAAALVLVDTPVVQRFIKNMASKIKKPTTAYVSTSIVGALTSFLGWYFGPVVTSLYARALGQNVKGVDYRLLAAVSYASFTISLTGISGTIPLFVATEGSFTELLGGIYTLDQTTFSVLNMVTAFAIVIVSTIIFYFIGKNKKEIVTFNDLAIIKSGEQAASLELEPSKVAYEPKSFAEKINDFRPTLLIFGLLGLVYLIYFFGTKGINGLNLNSVAFISIVIGFLVHKSPTTYLESFSRNIPATSSIALQFPIYGGIASILIASGLSENITAWMVSYSTEVTFPVLTFLITGFINLFVPSAGSQFTATAPFIIPAAQELGVEIPRAILSITFGDIWTNLIQPFWALLYFPILAVGTRLTVRDFMGYCLPILVAVGAIWILGLLFLPL
ncbi:short-chain fatty acid transporter [Bacillus timonensis]|uniref:Short-chain fatty acid transporter n=1 Tax=Bacillus timonensis TaxID=1033734 RepID=A0A4S3PJD3_9BACI|nr:TIGR00366 family protein [Bacillus timonensis]THE09521.1 short-chain fatty acid transporter [Bacillus timonensis]